MGNSGYNLGKIFFALSEVKHHTDFPLWTLHPSRHSKLHWPKPCVKTWARLLVSTALRTKEVEQMTSSFLKLNHLVNFKGLRAKQRLRLLCLEEIRNMKGR